MTDAAAFDTANDDGTLVVSLRGDWVLEAALPDTTPLFDLVGAARRVRFACERLGRWDSALVTLLARVQKQALATESEVDASGLPDGARRLLRLAFAVPERADARRTGTQKTLFERIGARTVRRIARLREVSRFVGEAVLALLRLVRGRATFQRSAFLVQLQETGAEAFGIVSLIAFLIGVILAFVGVMQLQTFGAGIYVADLVAIGMVREMGPIMTGIIMTGRTGASFAAELGTMKVNEEIDALATMGIDPMDFLVLPRLLALALMLPLLALYADLLGMLGGAAVALGMLDVSVSQYYAQTIEAVDFADVVGGLAKASVYGVLVALTGCLRGIECGNSAAAVGIATTSAVVTGIVLIVVSCGVMTVIYTNLGI